MFRMLVSGLLLWVGLPVLAEDFRIYRDYHPLYQGNRLQILESSRYYSSGKFLGLLRELDGEYSITVLQGEEQKVFMKAADFSESEKAKYPYEYAFFSGKAPSDRAAKIQLLAKYDPNAIKVLNELKVKLVFDYASTPENSSDMKLVQALVTGIHESVHHTNHTRVVRDEWIQDFHLMNGKKVSAVVNRTLPLKQLYATLSDEQKAQGTAGLHFEKTYLDSETGVENLLDELDAYSQSAITRIRLTQGLLGEKRSVEFHYQTSEGLPGVTFYETLDPGLPLMLSFLAEYLAFAKMKSPVLWKEILSRDREAIQALVDQSQEVLQVACATKSFSEVTATLARQATSFRTEVILAEVLGADFHFISMDECLKVVGKNQ